MVRMSFVLAVMAAILLAGCGSMGRVDGSAPAVVPTSSTPSFTYLAVFVRSANGTTWEKEIIGKMRDVISVRTICRNDSTSPLRVRLWATVPESAPAPARLTLAVRGGISDGTSILNTAFVTTNERVEPEYVIGSTRVGDTTADNSITTANGLEVDIPAQSEKVIEFQVLLATPPRFNFLEGDHALLRWRRVLPPDATQEQIENNKWADHLSIPASDGEVEGCFYLHNGYVDTIAHGTRGSITLKYDSQRIWAEPRLWAYNADSVSATAVGNGATTQMIGVIDPSVTVIDPGLYRLEPIWNSVRWLTFDEGSGGSVMPFPKGQSGMELFHPAGLELGDITGCWQYASYVTFKAKVVKVESTSATVTIQWPPR